MARRLTLIAGSGALVPLVLGAARTRRMTTQVIDLVGRDDLVADSVVRLSVSRARDIAQAVRAFGSTDLVLAGGVTLGDGDRRSIADALGWPGRIAKSFGDIGLATAFLLHFRLAGVRVIGVHQMIPDLLADDGHVAGPALQADVIDQARSALVAARLIGRLDLGQAVVSSAHRIVAAEDAGGTDELIERIARLRASGLIDDGSFKLILAKALKPRQPSFVDLPAIGADTVSKAAAAGIKVIAVEAHRTLVLERALIVERASSLGVSIIGSRVGRG